MKKVYKRRIKYLLVLAWCVVIFLFSQQNGQESSNSSGIIAMILSKTGIDLSSIFGIDTSFLIRKTAHFTEYFILAVLVYNAIKDDFRYGYSHIVSVVFTSIYAMSDELHQMFVPGRGPAVRDVIIDSCGGLTAIIIIFIVGIYKGKLKKRKYRRKKH